MALIKCKNLFFSYEGRPVVEDLNLIVEQGDYLCIVGENGSGKSTLVKGLLGLMPPSSGTVTFGDGLQRNQIGYLPQHTQLRQDFPASVWEVVASGCRGASPFLSKEQRDKALETMNLLGILEIKGQSFSELSGGQRQRVLLVRALLATSKLLLLDEPTAGLDPLITRELYETINGLHKERGLTIIMISHDIPAAIEYAAHILHLAHEAVFWGETADYILSPLGKAFAIGGKRNA